MSSLHMTQEKIVLLRLRDHHHRCGNLLSDHGLRVYSMHEILDQHFVN